MELWFVFTISLCITAFVRSIFQLFNKNLPPGPPNILWIGNFIWLRKPLSEFEFILRRFKIRYGSIFTVRIGPQKHIFISSHSMAHRALIQYGAIFCDRPPPPPTRKILNVSAKTISSASYGPNWRILRRNLTNKILRSSRVKSYSVSRRYVLSDLIRRLIDTSESESSVRLIDHFQYAMFCLFAVMCFGEKFQEKQIKEIESVQRALILRFRRFSVFNFCPRLGKILFRSRWKELIQLRQKQERVMIPLIRSRIIAIKRRDFEPEVDQVVAYVDTLVDLHLPEENRELDEGEILSLCSEFLSAGTDTSSTALQWIMANLVKYPHFQAKLYDEIVDIVGLSRSSQQQAIEEEDLHKMPYLKAVVLEALRRHPPGHFTIPRRVTKAFELDGYVIPRDGTVNFMVADMGWDPNVWPDPMEFKPERFYGTSGEALDITGGREIKMMPFGAGRRMCPGFGLALLHLEYLVANLIWKFEWSAIPGDEVDLSEKNEFSIVMKNPLRACISQRM